MDQKPEIFKHIFLAESGFKSCCNIYILSVDGVKFIGFEDINMGTSVTNGSEQIATEIVNELDLNPENCFFYEWYLGMDRDTTTVDSITYTWKKRIAKDPKWKIYCKITENPFKN